MRRRGQRWAALSASALLALTAATGCSSDDDGGAAATTTSTSSETSTSTSSPDGSTNDSQTWDGEISMLIYNVAGLPDILSGSNPERNTDLIGPKLNDFDLVLLQETWESPDPNPMAPTRVYHEILAGHSTHQYKSEMATQPLGANPERPEALLSDGLGTFSNFAMGPVTRVAWQGCFGGADSSDQGAADCLAMKGFAVTTVTLADGVEVDVYNLHAEAGSSPTDQELQRAGFPQLAAFIEERSAGRAVIVGGDTNLHTDEEPDDAQDVEDTEIWNDFLAAAGLTDACDALGCDDPGRIDKVAYRSGGGVELAVIERILETDRFSDDAGEQLSDHEALSFRLGWRKSS